MRNAHKGRLRNIALAGASLLLPCQARAQTQSPEDGEAADEIIVTAQHRSERLQDVPISAAVVTGQALAEQNLNSLEDLARNTPSVTIASSIGRSGALAMRGASSGNNPSFDQSVSTFVDGVYHGQARMAGAAFVDLERVEILRGPQSIFFGNNAIAGALNITSRRPGDAFDGWARALYGEGGVYAAEGALGGPLTPEFGVRAALSFTGSDGWLEHTVTGENAPHENNVGGRITFVYEPSANFDLTLKVEASRNRNDSGLFVQVANCGATPLHACLDAFDSDQHQTTDSHSDLDTFETVLTANYQLGAHTLTSITGYQAWDFSQLIDVDASPAQLIGASTPNDYGQFSQEFRIVSPVGGAWDWLAGIYFQSDQLDGESNVLSYVLTPAIIGNPGLAPLVPYLPLGQGVNYTQDETIASAFGSIIWHATDRLSFTGGLRYSQVRKEFDWSLYYGTINPDFTLTPLPNAVATLPNVLNQGTTGQLSGARTDEAWMPSLGVNYRVSPDLMAYATYSRAFLAGGFNYNELCAGCAAPDITRMPFAPEWVDAYELGLKGAWLDGRLRLGVALFRSEYEDLQTAASIPNAAGVPISIVRNAADSVSQGVEFDGQWAITDNFRLSASVTWLDSHYVEYFFTPTTNLAGRPTGYAPDWSGALSAEYAFDLPGDYLLTAHLSERFATEQYFGPAASPATLAPGYERWDARLTLETPDRRWAFDLIGENLTDEYVYTFLNAYPLAPGSNYNLQRQQPRHFSVQARFAW